VKNAFKVENKKAPVCYKVVSAIYSKIEVLVKEIK
jgi:hypothetical protein